MINLHTGLPGNGKTLYTIGWVREWAKRENRPVFYSGVKLTDKGQQDLGWQEIDAEKWAECPPGSIILIDEAQRVFRPRGNGAVVPAHVAALETHRHSGVDLVLITQHPMLIDNAVRRLAGKHRHMMRVFGMQAVKVHEWDAVRVDCEKPGRRGDSTEALWKYDKRLYELYQSAEVHTMKASVPARLWLLLALPFVVAALGWFAWTKLAKLTGKAEAAPPSEISAPAGKSLQVKKDDAKKLNPIEDLRQYVALSTPRVQGLPHTAPKYDQITQPTVAPVPAACIHSEKTDRCQCYSQQGTRLEVDRNICLDVAYNGFFEEFDPNGHQDKRERAVAVLDRPDGSLPLSRSDTRERPYVVSFSESDGYGVLGKRAAAAVAGTAK